MNALALFEDGHPHAHLKAVEDAGPVEQHAVEELQKHLELMSGARLPKSTAGREGALVLVGRSPEADDLLGEVDWASLGEDGCMVRTVGDRLILTGATPRGTLYAVYEFLEEVLGCRWLTPACSVIPPRPTIRVRDINIVHTPVFRYRDPFLSIAYNADWAARNRVNGSFYPLDEKRGGKWSYAGFVHTFYDLVPPAEHFARHPEYFAEVNGQRIGALGQLCLTHPAVTERVVEAVRVRMQKDPEARVVSISQNDCHGNCTCRACRALDEQEGSPSGSLLHFVNGVAQRLEAEFPHVLFDTLAYMYGVAPPRRVRPRHNVVVRLCHLNDPCDSHPLEQCDKNRLYLEQLRAWGRIAPELFVWDYFNNWANYFMPYPNLDAICADIPLYAQAGVTGIFCQIDGTPPKGSGDMAELRAYLLAKLLWRPERDGRQIIDEFLRLYYAAAAGPIQAYLDLLHGTVRGRPVHAGPYLSMDADMPFLTAEIMDKATELLDAAAERVSGDAEIVRRVEAVRLPVNYTRFCRRRRPYVIEGNRFAPPDPDVAQEGRRFMISAIKHGAEGLNEQGSRPIRDQLADLDGVELVTIERDGLRLFVAPSWGGRIVALLDPATGQDWMHQALPGEPGFPLAGGYEEYTQAGWRSPGWQACFVCERDGDTLWLSAAQAGEWVLERRYRLESKDSSPRLVIESSLTHTGVAPRVRLLRAHPELATGALEHAAIRLRLRDGSTEDWAPWRNDPSGSGSREMTGETLPAQGWALVRGKRQLAIEFSEDIIKCLPSWDRAGQFVRMDMYGNPHRLDPRDATTIRQVWTPGPSTA